MTQENAPAKKPVGLGKRKAPEESGDNASDGEKEEVYFPVNDEHDEIEQAIVMYEQAEACLDEPEKSVPLLRAVIHECDRLGRLKDLVTTGEDGGLEEKERDDRMRNLLLNEEFYRVFGDALYFLAFFEVDFEEEQETTSVNREILQAAIERYQLGLEEFPESKMLNRSLRRSQLVDGCLSGEFPLEICQGVSELVSDEDDLMFFVEAAEKMAGMIECERGLVAILVKLVNIGEEMIFEKELVLKKESIVSFLSLALTTVDILFNVDGDDNDDDLDSDNKAKAHIDFDIKIVSEILDACDQIIEMLNGKIDEPSSLHQLFLKLIAQFHLLRGSLKEMMEDDNDDAGNQEYALAVETWRKIESAYQVKIPLEILQLIYTCNSLVD